MKKLLLMGALSLALMGTAFAQTKKPSTATKKTVVEIVSNSPEHSTLIEAVKTAGLTETLKGTGPFTIFAPTNAAFAKLADDLEWDEASDQTAGNVNPNRSMDTTMQNRNTQDTMTQNRNTQDRTYRDTTMQNRTTTRDTIPRTRTDQNKMSEQKNALLSAENQEDLKTILQYHVVRGSYDSKALAQAVKTGNGKAELTTVQGEKLTVAMNGTNFVLEDARGAKAKVTTTDLKGSNGVIHVIDKVALPAKENTMER